MDCGKGSLTGSIIPDTDSVIFTFLVIRCVTGEFRCR